MSVALVLGCGQNVWEDARRALSLFAPDAFLAVKDMMAIWPLRVDYGVTLHPDRIAKYLQKRQQLGLSTKFPIWAHKQQDKRITNTTSDWQGSSGLFAVRIALQEGFTGVVCAGVPMDARYGHVTRKKDWDAVTAYYNGWKKHLPDMGNVRSMSGWTKAQLGAPTPDWLSHVHSAPPEPELVRLLLEKGDAQAKGNPREAGRASG